MKFAALRRTMRSCIPQSSRPHKFIVVCALRVWFALATLRSPAKFLPCVICRRFLYGEQTNNGVVLALGDICGKGLAAGMWTTHVVGMVRAQTATNSTPERIVAGVNRDICRMATTRPLASLFLAKLDQSLAIFFIAARAIRRRFSAREW